DGPRPDHNPVAVVRRPLRRGRSQVGGLACRGGPRIPFSVIRGLFRWGGDQEQAFGGGDQDVALGVGDAGFAAGQRPAVRGALGGRGGRVGEGFAGFSDGDRGDGGAG